jgi:pantetheine-phosphate adenylyltransferase
MRVGLYPGSFDPITNGHIDIIERSLSIVDKLIVAIGVSATKTPLFSFEDRAAMIDSEIGALAKQKGVELSVVDFNGLLVDEAKKHGVGLIIRGLRNAEDFEYEAQMTAMNRAMAPEVETVFLTAAPDVSFISSTLVRQILAMGGDISPFVPKVVLENI